MTNVKRVCRRWLPIPQIAHRAPQPGDGFKLAIDRDQVGIQRLGQPAPDRRDHLAGPPARGLNNIRNINVATGELAVDTSRNYQPAVSDRDRRWFAGRVVVASCA